MIVRKIQIEAKEIFRQNGKIEDSRLRSFLYITYRKRNPFWTWNG